MPNGNKQNDGWVDVPSSPSQAAPPASNDGWVDVSPSASQDLTRRPTWWDSVKNAWNQWNVSKTPQGAPERDPRTGLPVSEGPSPQDLRQQATATEQQRLADVAAGKPGDSGPSPFWNRVIADTRDIAGSMFTPKGAALGLAMTNPWTGVPASMYMVGEGGKQVAANLPETVQGNPDALQKTLFGGAEVAGGAAGTLGQGSAARAAIREAAMENPDTAALKAVGVDPNSPKAARTLADIKVTRPYAGAPKTQAELQAATKAGGPARTEIWNKYNNALQQVGNRVVQGPDGPATVSELEAERLKLSAQNARIKAKDPSAYQEVVQAGRTPAENIAREQAVQNAIDPELASTGLDPKLTRATMGGVKGVSRRIEGRMGGLETAPSGIGRLIDRGRINLSSSGPSVYLPENLRTAIAGGVRDIAAGRGWFRQVPADVAVREGFRNPGAKPNLTPFPPAPLTPAPPQYAAPAGPQLAPPPAPATPVGVLPPAGFPAQTGGLWTPRATPPAPTWSVPGTSVPSEAPGLEPTAVDLPDVMTTQGRPDLPPGLRGLTDAQINRLPASFRAQTAAAPPKPGTYSLGGRAEVMPPQASPPTDLTTIPKEEPSITVLPQSVRPDSTDQSIHPWQSDARVEKKVGELQQGADATIVARPNPDGTVSPVKGHQTPVAASRTGQPVNVVDSGPITDSEKAAMTGESHFFPQEDRAVPASLAKDAASERESLPEEVKSAPALPAKEGPASNTLQSGTGVDRRQSLPGGTGPGGVERRKYLEETNRFVQQNLRPAPKTTGEAEAEAARQAEELIPEHFKRKK